MSRKDTIKKVLWLSLGSALVFWPVVFRLSDIVFLYDFKNHIRMDRHRVTVISYWAHEMLPDTMRMYFCDEDNYAYLFWETSIARMTPLILLPLRSRKSV